MHIFLLTPISKFASNRGVNNDTTIFKLKEFTMRKLLEQLKLLLADKSGDVDFNLHIKPLIRKIKSYDAKHPFANLGLPKEDYELLQQVLKS